LNPAGWLTGVGVSFLPQMQMLWLDRLYNIVNLPNHPHLYTLLLLFFPLISFFAGLGFRFELGFPLAKQALHHSNHTSSPFSYGYFEEAGL
jgi:hypothetical protein